MVVRFTGRPAWPTPQAARQWRLFDPSVARPGLTPSSAAPRGRRAGLCSALRNPRPCAGRLRRSGRPRACCSRRPGRAGRRRPQPPS